MEKSNQTRTFSVYINGSSPESLWSLSSSAANAAMEMALYLNIPKVEFVKVDDKKSCIVKIIKEGKEIKKKVVNPETKPKPIEDKQKIIEAKPVIIEDKPKIIEAAPKIIEAKPQIIEVSGLKAPLRQESKRVVTTPEKEEVSKPSASSHTRPRRTKKEMDELEKKVRQMREDKPAYSPARIARELNISPPTVYKWLKTK